MKKCLVVALLVLALSFAAVGCTEEKKPEKAALVDDLHTTIQALKADKKAMDELADQLTRKINAVNLHIVQLEGTYQDLYEAQAKPTFWNTFDWISHQINIVILGLFVVWLLYSVHVRRRERKEL